MKRCTEKVRDSGEQEQPLLLGYSDPSEEYDSAEKMFSGEHAAQLPCVEGSAKGGPYKKFKLYDFLVDVPQNEVSEGPIRLSLGPFQEVSWGAASLHTSKFSGSKGVKRVRNIRSRGHRSLLTRILSSLSFLIALSSINSFTLALNNLPLESGSSNSSPLQISLLESNASKSTLSEGDSGTSLIELDQRVSYKPFGGLSSFFQSSISSSRLDRRKRSGGNRRGSKGRRGRQEEPQTKQTKWSDFMAKFDIANVHGSGVYVDLGGSATVSGQNYRMPTGRCPVIGKAVVLENGADFLNSITHHNSNERGLAFPATKVSSNSSEVDMENQLLSPISGQVLKSWNYKHESDLSNCAEYSKNIVPGSSPNSKYRYPFVYDKTDKLCYILYSPMQYNQGVKYCDTDGSDEGTSSLACMYPEKDKEDSNLFYGTSSMHMDWEVVCPVYPIKDAIFGDYDEDKDVCVPSEPIYVEDADSYAECSKILFEYSPSDIDISTNNETLSDVDRFKEAISTGRLSSALSIMFAPRYNEDRPIYTRGVGINWATYSKEEKKCNILDSLPTCLIISNGSYALTSITSPNEEDAVPYPCEIVNSRGFLRRPEAKKTQGGEGEESAENEGQNQENKAEGKEKEAEEFIPFTSLKQDGFDCPKYVHKVSNDSCGSYFECSASPFPSLSRSKKWIIAIVVVIVVMLILGGLGYFFFRNRKYKRYHSEIYDENHFYDSEMEDEHHMDNHQDHFKDQEYNFQNEDHLWSRHEPRGSDFTPVRISRVERHN